MTTPETDLRKVQKLLTLILAELDRVCRRIGVSYAIYGGTAIGASRGMALNISYSAWAIIFALVLQGTVPTATQVVCCIVILVGTVLAATPSWGDLLPRRAEKVSGQ